MNNSIKKGVVVSVILLFVSVSVIQSVPSKQISTGDIITVDDEGDGDYTSISEAVNNSNPGDTIEVYSGTYYEQGIWVERKNVALKGIPYELGEGNDTGKPLIRADGHNAVLKLIEENITVTGFEIYNSGYHDIIYIHTANNCMVSDNVLHPAKHGVGIYCYESKNVQIINNTITYAYNGIHLRDCNSTQISGNIITDVSTGIFSEGDSIELNQGGANTLYLNHFENNSVALDFFCSVRNIVKHNNFVNNSKHVNCDGVKFILLHPWRSITHKWIRNYWDDWSGNGPKMIKGGFLFFIVWFFWIPLPVPPFIVPLGIPLPWIMFDLRPAQEPYDIPGCEIE